VTNEFYDSVLPPPALGFRVAVVFKDGLKRPPSHKYLTSNESLVDMTKRVDALGVNVYHGCAAFKDPTRRKAENVSAVKTLWVDLDVGPEKPYATQKEAAAAFEQFRVALGLPKSWMISSGSGVHVYLPFTKSVSPENWDRIADKLAMAMNHYGVKHDSSRTQDKASILRVPGTSNHKTNPAKQVTIRRVGEEVPARVLYEKLAAYAEAHGLTSSRPAKTKSKETNDLIGTPTEYPPSTGDKVAARCAVIGEVERTGGQGIDYQVWWRAMGVAKHVTTPTETAIHWTRNRSKPQHDNTDAIEGMDSWNVGPTTCADMSKHSPKCQTCVHFGKIGSPIQLGQESAMPMVAHTMPTRLAEGEEGPATASVVMPQVPNEWGFKTQWVVEGRCTGTKTGYDDSKRTMYRFVKDGEDDQDRKSVV
jgi:hypothetical protein